LTVGAKCNAIIQIKQRFTSIVYGLKRVEKLEKETTDFLQTHALQRITRLKWKITRRGNSE